jgi:uncharacterized protein
MSSQKLPRTVSLRKSVNSRATYAGKVPLAQLARLADIAAAMDEAPQDIVASVTFGESDDYKPTLSLTARAKIGLQCQRCMGEVLQPIEVASTLTVVRHDEEAKNRLGELEPLIIDDDSVDLHALLEEEVLLALPIVAMHPEQNCSVVTRFSPPAQSGGDAPNQDLTRQGVKPSPFSVLAGLKQTD